MTAPAFRDTSNTTNANAATSIAVAVPATAVAGDCAIWWVEVNSATASSFNFNSTGSGWTIDPSAPIQNTNGITFAVAYKVLVSGDLSTSPSVSWTGSARNSSGMVVYSGADGTSPIHKSTGANYSATASTTHATPNVTTTVADCTIVELIGDEQATAAESFTAPSGFTRRVNTTVGGSGNRQGQAAGDNTTGGAAGTYGGDTWTASQSSAAGVVWTLAVQPPAGNFSGSANMAVSASITTTGALSGGPLSGTANMAVSAAITTSGLLLGRAGTPSVKLLADDGTGAWTIDLSQFLDLSTGYTITRGREDEFQTVNPGQASFTLDNHDGGCAPGVVVGNLLPAADATLETGIGSWAFNTVLGAYDSGTSLAQSTTRAVDGTHSLLATWSTTVKGNYACTTVNGLTVGRKYTWSAQVYVPAGSPAVRPEVAFVASGSYTTVTNAWTTISVTFTATSTSHFVGVQCASATSGNTCYVDAGIVNAGSVALPFTTSSTTLGMGTPVRLMAGQAAAVAQRTNLVTNPSFESNVTGWTGTGCTVAQGTASPVAGTKVLQGTATTSNMSVATATGTSGMPVTAGTTYTLSAYVRAATTGRNGTVTVSWYNSSGTLLSTSAPGAFTDSVATWTRATITAAAPASSAFASVTIAWSTTIGVSEVHYVDAVLFEAAATVGDYFDGSSVKANHSYGWTGTANASSSTDTTLTSNPATRFTGFIDSAVVVWDGAPAMSSELQVTAVDLMTRLQRQTLLAPIPQALTLDSGIFAHYPLTETTYPAADSSGQGQPLLAGRGAGGSGAAPGWASGDPSPADGMPMLLLQAGGRYVSSFWSNTDHPFNQTLAPSNPMVIEFAVSTQSTAASTLVEAWNGTVGTLAVAMNTSGQIRVQQPGASYDVHGTTAINDGNVHFVAVTIPFGSLTVSITIDGTADTVSGSGGAFIYPYPIKRLNVGQGDVVSNANTFTGSIGHLLILNNATTITNDSALFASGFTTDSTDTRIARYATYAGLTAAQQSLEPGITRSVAVLDTTDMGVLDAMQQVATTEGGVLFARLDGNLVMHNRYHRALQTTAKQSFTSDKVNADVQVTLDTNGIVNDAIVVATGASGANNQVTNTASVAAYGRFTESLSLLLTTDAEAQARAQWESSVYATPTVRIPHGTFDLLTLDTTSAGNVLAMEIGDRFMITGFPSQSPVPTADLVLEGYTESLTVSDTSADWSLMFNATPWSLYQMWILGDNTYGVLGSTTRLGY